MSEKKIFAMVLISILSLGGMTFLIITLGINNDPIPNMIENHEPNQPNAPSGDNQGCENSLHAFTVSTTDSDGDNIKYQIDWGDGTTNTSDYYTSSGYPTSFAHQWNIEGSYSLRVRAQDEPGLWSSWSSIKNFEVIPQSTNQAPNQPNAPSGPASGEIDTDYSFSFNTTDIDGDNLRYQIDWGDGITNSSDYFGSGISTSISHQWSTEGTYSLRVRAQDEHGLWSSWSSSESFNASENQAPNQPDTPTGYQNDGNINTNYQFFFKTTDPDEDLIKYQIDWGDGTTNTTDDYTSSGYTISSWHQWSTEGIFYIIVRAQDEHGLWSSWSNAETFEVIDFSQNHAPYQPSAPSGVDQGHKNSDYSFSFSTTDPDGDQIKYQIDWGDGTTTTTDDFFNSGTSTSLTHQWSTVGTYYLRVRAQDEYGLWSSWSNIKNFEVIPQLTNHAPNQPNAPSGPDSGEIDTDYSFSFSTTDPDGDQIKYQIDWGDGTTTTTDDFFNSGTSTSLTHQWSTEGTYYIKVRAQDEHGLWSSWSENCFILISDIIIVP